MQANGSPTFSVTLSGDRHRVDPALIDEFDAAGLEREVADALCGINRGEDGAVARLEQGLGRFRGDFLDGEPVGDWHLEHRDRLQRVYVDGLMKLGDSFADDERHGKAAEAYRRVLARDELHEEALVALMRCQAGRRSRGAVSAAAARRHGAGVLATDSDCPMRGL
jgi:two-component SAPR family response regulator